MANFLINDNVPAAACSQSDIELAIETAEPTTDVVEAGVLDVVGGVLTVSGNVPVWRKYTVGHADFQAAALTNDIELFQLPAKGVVHAVKIKHSVPFAGAGIAAYTLSVGIVGTLAKYAAAFDVFQAAGDTTMLLNWLDYANSTTDGETHAAGGTSIRVAATAVGANLDQSTAGAADIWVLWSVTV